MQQQQLKCNWSVSWKVNGGGYGCQTWRCSGDAGCGFVGVGSHWTFGRTNGSTEAVTNEMQWAASMKICVPLSEHWGIWDRILILLARIDKDPMISQ
eukprot:scaffold111_cov89-Cylindrotheca_fusiformis.AAC.2